MSEGSSPITELLTACAEGQRAADLFPVLYTELKAIARQQLGGERQEHTLQPTALVNEAYLRLVGSAEIGGEGKSHFFRMAAQAMRRVLVDHARSRNAQKRGGDRARLELVDEPASVHQSDLDWVELDDALRRLAELSERESSVFELRFFGGLSVSETAAALGVSASTVKGDWQMARSWLLRELIDSDT